MTTFTTYTDRQIVDNMLDVAASLTWRQAAEDELKQRGYRTRQVNGNLRTANDLLATVERCERRAREAQAAKPEGRTMRELRYIVAASHARLDRIGDVWDELTDAEQEALATRAEAMHASGDTSEQVTA